MLGKEWQSKHKYLKLLFSALYVHLRPKLCFKFWRDWGMISSSVRSLVMSVSLLGRFTFSVLLITVTRTESYHWKRNRGKVFQREDLWQWKLSIWRVLFHILLCLQNKKWRKISSMGHKKTVVLALPLSIQMYPKYVIFRYILRCWACERASATRQWHLVCACLRSLVVVPI